MYDKDKIRLTTLSHGSGWACKIGPEDLSQVLGKVKVQTNDSVLVGYENADDAAAYRLNNGKTLVQTVDFFTPLVDSPYEFGQIAAANALSDIYAMGGNPLFALNIVGFPIKELPRSILTEILQGGADKAAEAGVPIVGGHSVDDKEPKYGLVVTGEVDEKDIWTNSGAKAGDILILTKALGTGIIATAIKKGKASEESIFAAIKSMSALNMKAAKTLEGLTVNAVTDVTGYGLLGHLKEVCTASGVSVRINFKKLNFLLGVKDLANCGMVPGGTHRNLEYYGKFTKFSPQLSELDKLLIADAQTSGGLLISLPKDHAEKYIDSNNFSAFAIGEVILKEDSLIYLDS